MTFTCGCQPPTYCPTHLDWWCHDDSPWAAEKRWADYGEECPPCRTARWASVNLDSRATPTRRER